ncbi:MAG TPA: TIGR01777 family oxidoreductase [Flavobacterium sp.]|jgi:hypothetical protein
MKKIVIAAGTGFLGKVLIDHFAPWVNEIVVLTRGKNHVHEKVSYINWDAKTLTGWERELENADVLINLAGKSVDCRYTTENKDTILRSRIDSTTLLNAAVLQCQRPPKHWLNSSTSTIYRFSLDKQMDEVNGEIGDDFSMNVAKAWENAFFETETPYTVKTALRTSIVLGRAGGAFVPIKNLTRLGFGGKQGKGNQFISWIHETDFARAVEFVILNSIAGVVNVVSPQPIKNAEFMKILRKTMHVRNGIPVSEKMLTLGAKIIGTEPELVLKSRNVIPRRLEENGFYFEYPELEDAFKNLLK